MLPLARAAEFWFCSRTHGNSDKASGSADTLRGGPSQLLTWSQAALDRRVAGSSAHTSATKDASPSLATAKHGNATVDAAGLVHLRSLAISDDSLCVTL